MNDIDAIEKRISYLRGLINDWNLEKETIALYEAKIASLEAEKNLKNQIIDW